MEVDKPIIISVILFIVLILVFYLILPKYQALQAVLLNVGEKEAEFQSQDAYFVEITSLYKELMLYQDSLKKIEDALPSRFSLSSLINLLYKKGVENGIIVQKISAGQSSDVGDETNIKGINISLSVMGSYPSLENFVASMEKSVRLIEGENISFSVEMPTITNPQPLQSYPISLEIKVYYYQSS